MAKQRRPPNRRTAAAKPAAKRRAAPRTAEKSTRRRAISKTSSNRRAPRPSASSPNRGPVVKIRETYARAVRLYEKGLRALQRNNYDGAAAIFQQILEKFSEERELCERAQLYLNVCERGTGAQAISPKSIDERILAATVALNHRDVDRVLSLLQTVPLSHPKQDHVQYMLALVHALRDDSEMAIEHLGKAVALNPDNRVQAKQEPDFDSIRKTQAFIDVLKTP